MNIGFFCTFFAFKTISVPVAFFVNEYKIGKKNNILIKGIYSFIKHPLFIGGVLFLLGINVTFCRTPSSYIFIIINILTIPIYNIIEDKRQEDIFGDEYKRYKKQLYSKV
jgi:protein-S-isoprenylcysteine O-methyltransferase Ste14